jgi:hypothetical protein
VESSLLMLVVVSLLMLGLHLGEVMEISLKSTMISHSVLFDAQGHEVRGPGGAVPTQGSLDTRFAREAVDLDLRSSTAGAGYYRGVFASMPGMTGFATAGHFRVVRPTTCSYPPDIIPNGIPAGLDQGWSMEVNPVYTVDSLRLPHHFADGSLVARASYGICALGRMSAGRCGATFKIMLDDWAEHTESPPEPWDKLDCGLMGCANTNFFDRSQAHFTAQSGQASAFATAVLGSSPVKEDTFWMSFRDANAGFEENGFKTGPGPATRANCYLGANCP